MMTVHPTFFLKELQSLIIFDGKADEKTEKNFLLLLSELKAEFIRFDNQREEDKVVFQCFTAMYTAKS